MQGHGTQCGCGGAREKTLLPIGASASLCCDQELPSALTPCSFRPAVKHFCQFESHIFTSAAIHYKNLQLLLSFHSQGSIGLLFRFGSMTQALMFHQNNTLGVYWQGLQTRVTLQLITFYWVWANTRHKVW